MKACCGCKYFMPPGKFGGGTTCTNVHLQKDDVLWGKVYTLAAANREPGQRCGPDAVFFERRKGVVEAIFDWADRIVYG